MTPEQLALVFQGKDGKSVLTAPRRVGVLLQNGQLLHGMGLLDSNGKVLRLEVDRVYLAHLTKPPRMVSIAFESIMAVTEDTSATPSAALPDDGQIGKTVIEAHAQGEKAAHDYQSQVQGLHRDEGGDATPASGTVELPKPV
jgi:hypothetical protein